MSEPWSTEHLDRLRREEDPAASELGSLLNSGATEVNEVWKQLVRSSATDLAGDTRYTGFLQEVDTFNDFDKEKMAAGQRFFATWGPLIAVSLLTTSLPNTYAAEHGVKALHATARLQTDTTRRVRETALLLLRTMKPGQDGLDADARREIKRVRLMHSVIRYLLNEPIWERDPVRGAAGTQGPAAPLAEERQGDPSTERLDNWNDDEWGAPLNQEDLLGALMAFAYLPVRTMQRERIRFSSAEADEYVYAWSVVGRLLGVDPGPEATIPQTVAEARACWDAIARRVQRKSPEGAAMTRALIVEMQRTSPRYVLDGIVNEAFCAQLAPDGLLEMLDLHRTRRWKWTYAAIRKVLGVLHVQELVLTFRDQAGYHIVERMVRADTSYRAEDFQFPESLAEFWYRDHHTVKRRGLRLRARIHRLEAAEQGRHVSR